MKLTYTVLLKAEPEGGFTVLVPALPGCISYGENIPAALGMAEEAIECYLLVLQDEGETPPFEGEDVTIAAEDVSGTLLGYKVTVKLQAATVA